MPKKGGLSKHSYIKYALNNSQGGEYYVDQKQ